MNPTVRHWLQTWTLPIILVVLWEMATGLELLDPRFFIPFHEVAISAMDQLAGGRLASDILITLQRLGLAFALAAVGGVFIGVASGQWVIIERLIRPVTDTLYPMPKIAVLPLFIIIVGRGELAFILTAFATAFFQIIISTRSSVRNVDTELIEAGRNFGAVRFRYFTRLLFPAIGPALFNGLRLGLATCLITLTAAEFVAAESGLGAMIHRAGQTFAVDEIYTGLVLIGLIGLIINLAFRLLEPVLLPWQRRDRQEQTSIVGPGA